MDSNAPKKSDASDAAKSDAASTPTSSDAASPAKTTSHVTNVNTPEPSTAATDAAKTAGKPAGKATGDGAPSSTPAVPAAGGEPAKQVASTASAHHLTPPSPSSYEMPDDYASENWFDTTKAWVEKNPALAVLAAAGAGLVIGRVVMGLVPDPEPPSLTDRIEKRARAIEKDTRKSRKKAATQARAFASDAGDTVQDQLHRAADALRDAASSVSESAEHGVERTKDLAETVSDAVKVALTGVAAKKVDEWVSRVKG